MKDFVSVFLEYINYLHDNSKINIGETVDQAFIDNLISQITTIYDKKYINLLDNQFNFQNFHETYIKQASFTTADHKRLMNLVRDWYASGKTLAQEHKNMQDPYKAGIDDLATMIESFGVNFHYWMMPTQKPQYFLDLVNLYHIKGSPQCLHDVISYFFQLESEIYEYWLEYSISNDNLYFRGVPALDNRVVTDILPEIVKRYQELKHEPHWYYTEPRIRKAMTTNQISLPSMTPFFNLVLVCRIEDTIKAYMYLSYVARCMYQNYIIDPTTIDAFRKYPYNPTGTKLSLLDVILAYDVLFNERYGRNLPQDPASKRTTYNNVAGIGRPKFEEDYEDGYGFIDVNDSQHDPVAISDAMAMGTASSSVTNVLDMEIITKNVCPQRNQESSAIDFDMFGFVSGGRKEVGGISDKIYRYDVNNRSWSEEIDMPIPLRNHTMISNDDYIYILGGVTTGNNFNNAVYMYDQLNRIWTELPFTLPWNIIDFGCVLLKEKFKVLIFGGYNFTTKFYSSKCYEFDLRYGTYTELANFPYTPFGRMGIAANDSKDEIMIVGGFRQDLTYSSAYIYNITTDSWATAGNDLETRGSNYLVFDGNDYINVGGLTANGETDPNIVRNLIQAKFNIIQGTSDIHIQIQAYLDYLDLIRLYYKPIFHETFFDISQLAWRSLDPGIDMLAHVIIDSSFPNIYIGKHGLYCLQPLVVTKVGGVQTGITVSNNVYLKKFISRGGHYGASGPVETIEDGIATGIAYVERTVNSATEKDMWYLDPYFKRLYMKNLADTSTWERHNTSSRETAGMCYDKTNKLIWVTDHYKTEFIHSFDTNGTRVSGPIAIPVSQPGDMTHDGTDFWIVDKTDNTIKQVDGTLFTLISTVTTSFTDIVGLAYFLDTTNSTEYFWIMDRTTSSINKVNATTLVSEKTFATPTGNSSLLEYGDGFLWCTDDNTKLTYKIDPANGALLLTFKNPENYSRWEKWEDRYDVRKTLLSRTGINIALDETDSKIILQSVNPDLYNFIMDRVTVNEEIFDETIYYLLFLLDTIAGDYGLISTFRALNLDALARIARIVVDFHKPVHSRYLGVGSLLLPFDSPAANTWCVDDDFRPALMIPGDEKWDVGDLTNWTINMNIKHKIQPAYPYDYHPYGGYNEYDWYTYYENLDIFEVTVLYLDMIENIQWARRYDSPMMVYDRYTIYENLMITQNHV